MSHNSWVNKQVSQQREEEIRKKKWRKKKEERRKKEEGRRKKEEWKRKGNGENFSPIITHRNKSFLPLLFSVVRKTTGALAAAYLLAVEMLLITFDGFPATSTSLAVHPTGTSTFIQGMQRRDSWEIVVKDRIYFVSYFAAERSWNQLGYDHLLFGRLLGTHGCFVTILFDRTSSGISIIQFQSRWFPLSRLIFAVSFTFVVYFDILIDGTYAFRW